MNTFVHAILLVLVCSLVTFLTRALPFLIFGDRPLPKLVQYLGNILPAAVIAVLVIYCYKSMDLLGPTHGLPELLAGALVVVLHLWKRNNLISIGLGTVCYMVLVQLVFV